VFILRLFYVIIQTLERAVVDHPKTPGPESNSTVTEPITDNRAATDGPHPDPALWGYGDWDTVRRRGYDSPGARKEKLRQRAYRHSGPRRPSDYAELRVASSFSFLRGASLPEDLIERAAELELPAVALLDRNGVYGAPRFYQAAKQAGVRALVGAEVVVEWEEGCSETGPHPFPLPQAGEGAPSHNPQRPTPTTGAPTRNPRGHATASVYVPQNVLPLLVEDRTGYRNLCKLVTSGALGHPKGEARVDLVQLAAHAEGLHCLVGGGDDPVSRALASGGLDAARPVLERICDLFGGANRGKDNDCRVHVELQRHGLRAEEHRNRALLDLARRLRLPVVATNGVRYARDGDKDLHDVMTCIRNHTQLDAAGALLASERQRHLRSAREMAELFADQPRVLDAARELAQRLDFTLQDLGYRFPDYPLPPGETPMSLLRQLTWNGARARFRPLTAKAQSQIEKELRMIEKLDLAGYFLIVWDIVRFCQEQGILAQGRGSAANSAVCYALRITAVDPVKMDLLFERFLSEERGEWPDIDLDLPSGDQREKVIQYVYRRYGPKEGGGHGAAMTANVITYRDRLAAREVAKALGYSPAQVDQLAKGLGSWHYDIHRGDSKSMDRELDAAGFDPAEPRIQLFAKMWQRLQNHPRHLGQHSGGMVIAAGRLDEVVPLEPAAMPNRVVVQWDKDDCADLGLIKVDLLGLGMLSALEEAVPLVRRHEKVNLDLAHLPPDDPATYEMIRRADTVGTFQIESRAQMASLPRNRPEKFYDLVIQVAIIRPGPIVGKLAHPFFERRLGREAVTYPHPSLKPILERTLGVPIFQEQILKLAMTAAGFTGGEAEELRRAMGFKRSMERMGKIEERLIAGMRERGIPEEGQQQILQAITSFALYGFPESHAASFALIAYASAYLKRHHPTAFFLSLLNAWPMGFYHPATLVKEAQRAGVAVLPIDVSRSGWRCRWEERPASPGAEPVRRHRAPGGIRIGMRYVKGLRQSAGEAIEREQALRPFASIDDLVERCALRDEEATNLAAVGALAALGHPQARAARRGDPERSARTLPSHALTRREALWQVARAVKPRGPLYAGLRDDEASPLPEMTPLEETAADFAVAEITTGPHPMTFFREGLRARGVVAAADLDRLPADQRVRTAGSVIVRQRPGTAKGLLFLTLEDETGMCQALVMPDVLQQWRSVIVGAAGLVVEGVLQKRDGSLSVKADRFWPLDRLSQVPSHDFR
jgi:error-prone DNA polymerase